VPLNHVALTVSDRERSARFYGEHFGLVERVHDDEHLLIVGSPDGSLVALTEGRVPRDARAFHFGFQLGDAGEVRSARERLRSGGVEETEWQDDGGMVRVQVADPDGYRVELFAYEDLPPARSTRQPPRSRWTSFLADSDSETPRVLYERGNPAHRLRVEHNRSTLLVHLSDEDGSGWTVLAIDRPTRRWAIAQRRRQAEAAEDAFRALYPGG
jgi:catechol 2,3-dioxygenase-like lactoylglutathione lyase family enzyme